MKYLLLPLTLLLFAFADEHKQPESPGLPWRIISSDKDPSVQSNESLIEFRFLIDGTKARQRNIVYSYNAIQDTAICSNDGELDLYVKPGRYKFQFYLDQSHYEVVTDSVGCKGGYTTTIEVDFRNSEIMIEVDKPVIYLYPESTTDVNVKLNFNGNLGFTWPQYNEGWNVTAQPDGSLQSAGKSFDYLFWEGSASVSASSFDNTSGYIVQRDTLADFFEHALTKMNLSPRERQDFITYWCPRMIQNEFNYIHFASEQEYNSIATMNITPQPDEVFRVFMVWSKADPKENTVERFQDLPRASRKGFTVVEWGGAEISNNEL